MGERKGVEKPGSHGEEAAPGDAAAQLGRRESEPVPSPARGRRAWSEEELDELAGAATEREAELAAAGALWG